MYAVSTVGTVLEKEASAIWCKGIAEALKHLNPECLIVYGTERGYDFGEIPVKHVKARDFVSVG